MDVKSNNGGGVPMRSGPSAHQELVLDNVQHQFAPDHVMSPMRVQNRLMYVRPTVGASYVNMNNSINQRFTASSRLVPEDGMMPRVVGFGGGNNNYNIKRSMNEYAGPGGDYGFRIKFPRNTDKSRGLRHFSNKVCEKVKEKGQTNYNEVADELVAEYFDSLPDPPTSLEKQQYDTKNIRRRVYDALNVLMAMNIIEKEKKEIHWVGLPTSSFAECRRLEEEKAQRQDRLRQKTEQLQELIIQLVAYKSLVQRNRDRERSIGRPPDAAILYLPYIIVNTDKKTLVDCSISHDKTEYLFSFDRPFEIHDDIEVLKRLGLAFGLDSGMVSPDNVAHVKNCLPHALRDYVDQIIEGALSGGVINKSGKGSQTVVISANQQDRKPMYKFAVAGPPETGGGGGGGGGGGQAMTPSGARSSFGTNGYPPGAASRGSVGYGAPTGMMERPTRLMGALPPGQPVARMAVIPRTISSARYANLDQYGQHAAPQQMYGTYSGRQMGVPPQRHHYMSQQHSQVAHQQQHIASSNGRGAQYMMQQSRGSYVYQDPRHQQQMYTQQELQQQGVPPEEYLETDEVYEMEGQEY